MKRKIVSIVGRPNVGKSTLFNRIIRKREAIVDDAPGITRDRKAAPAEWESVPFMLVDTGGFIPGSSDVIDAGINRQVLQAIEESDVIIFLVDCETGITDVDDIVARTLRKSGRPVIPAVNKVDDERREADAAEFIRLGLGEPVLISAQAGRGVGDLLSDAVALLNAQPLSEPEIEPEIVKLAIVGKPNVGKSTFINRILGEERLLVTPIAGTTRDAVDVRINWQKKELILVDTAGLRKRSRINDQVEYYSNLRTHNAIEACDVACVFINADEGITMQDMAVIRAVVEARRGIVLAFNKWDLVKNDQEKIEKLNRDLDLRLQGLQFIPTQTMSCLTGTRVFKILDKAWKVAQERKKRIPSPELNNLIETLNRTYQPPAVQGKRVRIYYGTQTGDSPPKFAFFANHPNLLRDDYKRFLENSFRKTFGFEGVPISFVFRKK
ncbi:ribosome biogenesis GTPase Der [bacterium]|nr:ribosome biogenesis GTPase Der [bacterium]